MKINKIIPLEVSIAYNKEVVRHIITADDV
jgi:hypothetical protein